MSNLSELIQQYNELSSGAVDYQKYAYFAATHHSTAIEGSTLTENEVINLLEYGKPAANKPIDQNMMVYDHYEALQYVATLAKNKTPLTPHVVQQIGAKVMHRTGGYVNTILGAYNIANGDFRLGSVRAGTRTFPDAKKVPLLVGRFCEQLNEGLQTAQTLEAQTQLAFKAHFDFVSIHPFGDGNGRTSRLIMNYVQLYFGLPLAIVFKQDRIKYINALEAARHKDDLTPFVAFMSQQYRKWLKAEIRSFGK